MDSNTQPTAAVRMPQVGDQIAGRYELMEVIGEGGMGQVFRAVQHPVGRSVALKVLLGEFVEDNVKQARFLREAQILANLKSSHTVSLIDFGVLDDGVVFIAMEYLEGGTLRELIDRGALPVRTAYTVAQQILKSLAEAHAQGIIHRDLKPGNVLIDHIDGERIVVRVADFGIAKWHNPEPSDEGNQLQARIDAYRLGQARIGTDSTRHALGHPRIHSARTSFCEAD